MSNWAEAILFGFALMAMVLGVSSLIMAMLQSPVAEGESPVKAKIEYGFFGAAGVVLSALFIYAM
ncbi:hypothetical protein P2G88_05890 [Aliiglaciecola sp. CAU 1673]|uniref:hypothetical protein n=1 Tax=Aliiglaciecola sp. CAU 1673 TaxID=3032595 RepID=UPI0023DA031C|nr:hypothetical protein [Aliiglaciecola sp. CAU 1673]MDF2177775.1 hypothetical protein [Aliiglaciecola sp. CAU 1673]